MVKKINGDQKHRTKILSKFKTQKQGRYYRTPITQSKQACYPLQDPVLSQATHLSHQRKKSQGNTKLTTMCVIGEDSKIEQSKCLMIAKDHKPKNLNTL